MEEQNNITIKQSDYKDFLRYLENKSSIEDQIRIIKLYDMPEDSVFVNITDRILRDKYCEICPDVKREIIKSGRVFFIYKYPSDNLQITGYVSYVPTAQNPKTIVMIRGGNRSFGIPHPGYASNTQGQHIYIGTTIRDCINPGRDEFGGEDVNDVINLVKFIPDLSTKLGYEIPVNNICMIGVSRGAMQMLLALARSTWLQSQVKKAISVIGLLNMQETMKARIDMVNMFYTDFRLNEYNKESWIFNRNPIEHVEKIRKDLPILIIQASNDIRITACEGESMYEKLKSLGHDVTYMQSESEGHVFNGINSAIENWLDLG